MALDRRIGDEALYRLRHSTAHVMAEAVLAMFPEGKLAFGPPIENGFYYDFDLPRPLATEDLAEIEQRMQAIIRSDHAFLQRDVSLEEARRCLPDSPISWTKLPSWPRARRTSMANPALSRSKSLSLYTHHHFTDLCRGPHLDRTGEIPADAFKLLNVAGAYWRGDEKQPMLQRIYGTVWPTAKELQEYLAWLDEVEKRDHRRLGKELDLFQHSRGGRRRAWSTGIPRVHASGPSSRSIGGSGTLKAATSSSTRRTSGGPGCGRQAGTWTFTGRACTRPWTSTAWTITSSP